MMNSFIRELVGSLVLIISGTVIISICCNLDSYHRYFYNVNRTEYIITQVFFWIGLIFFITGIINLFRASIRRRSPAFRGVTLSTAPQPMQPTSVTVIGRVLPSGFRQDQIYPAGLQQKIYPPGPQHQIYPPGPQHQIYPPGPQQQIYPPGPQQQIYPAGPQQQIYPGQQDNSMQPS